MASKMLVDHLMCSLCLGTLKNPKLLPCHHTFCEACLHRLVKSTGNNLQCPQCRKRLRLSLAEVRGLQTNFYLTPFLEKRQDMCQEHPEEVLRFLCVPCDKAICCKCLLSLHNKHEVNDFEKALKRAKAKLQECRVSLDTCRTHVSTHHNEIQNFKTVIENKMQTIETTLRRRAKTIHAIVDGIVEKHLLSMRTHLQTFRSAEWSAENKLNFIQGLQERLGKALDKNTGYKDVASFLSEFQNGLDDELEKMTKHLVFERNLPMFCCEHENLRGEPIKQLLGDVIFAPQVCQSTANTQ